MVQVASPLPAVDHDDELPVGLQLAWSLRAAIARGALSPGDRLPGLREAASQAGVNVNTVRAVFGRLEADGLLISHHGLGTFVNPDLQRSEALAELARDLVERARSLGVDPRDLARVAYAAGGATDEAAARRELRRQIGRLEAQLASYPEARPDGERHPLLRPKAHVAGLGELEQVRDALTDLLKEARAKAEGQTRHRKARR
jgi:GntR family transcriptional regulator